MMMIIAAVTLHAVNILAQSSRSHPVSDVTPNSSCTASRRAEAVIIIAANIVLMMREHISAYTAEPSRHFSDTFPCLHAASFWESAVHIIAKCASASYLSTS